MLRAQATSKNARKTFNAASTGVDMRSRSAAQTSMKQKAPHGMRKARAKAWTALQRYQLSKRQVSTFNSGLNADRYYAMALRSQRKKVSRWLKDPNGKVSFAIGFDAKSNIGTVYSARNKTFKPATKGSFYLQKTKDGKSFFPVSASLH